jgi:hypothetical protein
VKIEIGRIYCFKKHFSRPRYREDINYILSIHGMTLKKTHKEYSQHNPLKAYPIAYWFIPCHVLKGKLLYK